MSDHHSHYHTPASAFWRTRYAVGFVAFAAIAAYFLWEEHRAHLLGALPFLFVLACPLMHVFMHHGHGHNRHAHPGSVDDGTEAADQRDEGHP
jgi:hypothetical protein